MIIIYIFSFPTSYLQMLLTVFLLVFFLDIIVFVLLQVLINMLLHDEPSISQVYFVESLLHDRELPVVTACQRY
jgi:hypothetical protein